MGEWSARAFRDHDLPGVVRRSESGGWDSGPSERMVTPERITVPAIVSRSHPREPLVSHVRGSARQCARVRGIANLYDKVRDAVRCHFEEGQVPKVIRLHFVRDEVITA